MPWTPDRYPVSMRRLPPEIRLKAIEIANALLAQGCDDGKAIRIGIAKAKQWATRGNVGAPANWRRPTKRPRSAFMP